jgi:hypothetical protein
MKQPKQNSRAAGGHSSTCGAGHYSPLQPTTASSCCLPLMALTHTTYACTYQYENSTTQQRTINSIHCDKLPKSNHNPPRCCQRSHLRCCCTPAICAAAVSLAADATSSFTTAPAAAGCWPYLCVAMWYPRRYAVIWGLNRGRGTADRSATMTLELPFTCPTVSGPALPSSAA